MVEDCSPGELTEQIVVYRELTLAADVLAHFNNHGVHIARTLEFINEKFTKTRSCLSCDELLANNNGDSSWEKEAIREIEIRLLSSLIFHAKGLSFEAIRRGIPCDNLLEAVGRGFKKYDRGGAGKEIAQLELTLQAEAQPRKQDCCPVKLNVDLSVATVGEEHYSLTDAQGLLLKALIDAKGDYVAAGSVVERPGRVFEGLPDGLQELITRDNKGYRINWRMP